MNEFFFKVMLKQEVKKIIGYSLGLALYEWLITWVYPIIVQSPEIKELPKCFPTTVKRAFGVSKEEIDTSYEAYVSAQLLGRIWTLIMSVFCLNAVNSLVVEPVERGIMVYPLSSPVSRDEILSTQIGVFISELALVTCASFAGLCSATGYFKIKIDRWQYFRLGTLALSLCTAISAYSLLVTLLFNCQEEALRWASALTFLFYGLDVVSSIDDRFLNLKYITPFGLFRPQEVLQGQFPPTREFITLSGITGLSIILTRIIFTQKDLTI